MSLYNDLSEFYDDVFAVSEAELDFVIRSLPQQASVLDVGCGTGNKTIHFAKQARKVMGIDPDSTMIAKAKVHNSAPHVEYRLGTMEYLGEILAGERFSAVTCLGNTLVHLTSLAEIQDVLKTFYELLDAGGVFIGQILHYDFILDQQITALPILETEEVRFERRYDLSGVPIQFITRLFDKKQGHTFESSTPLYPLKKQELADALQQVGFTNVEFFGSYAGEPLTDQSLPLIVRCYKSA